MPDLIIPYQSKGLLTYQVTPRNPGPWPGLVVIHDALGMSTDVRNQCDWLANEGYLAEAPDLFDGKNFLSCIFKIMRQFKRKEGPLFDKIETVRQHLLENPNSNGKVGVIGFCFGGGFAVLLSSGYGFDSASVNYGGFNKEVEEMLKDACPIVGSYGALDRTLKGEASRLREILSSFNIDHDIKEYENTDHAFMNDHDPQEVPFSIKVIAFLFGGGDYHEESTKDARKRIIAFFDKYLK